MTISSMLVQTRKMSSESLVTLGNFIRAHESQYSPGEYDVLLQQVYDKITVEIQALNLLTGNYPEIAKEFEPTYIALYDFWDWFNANRVYINL